ncbi:hypothetical protein ACIQD5_35775 [Streptomyces microflavus]|uniref:hypothetical protein n=1 Tax=Streptomyces microflavus TaxID=1919 RepID=UPI0038055D70
MALMTSAMKPLSTIKVLVFTAVVRVSIAVAAAVTTAGPGARSATARPGWLGVPVSGW